MKEFFIKRSKIKIIYIVIVIIFISVIWFLFFENGSKYDRAARNAAKTSLLNEADSYKYTSVKTGRLTYMRTFYNSSIDTYRVSYYAKFEPADEENDEWVEISVDLSGVSLSVKSTDLSYFDVDYYEDEILPKKYKTYTSQENKDGKWTKVE